ncbi:MAG: hypothetical protein ACO1OF_10615 [Adhaeribacter sp.]
MPDMFKDLYYFEWSELFDFEEETKIGIETFKAICSNQENFVLLAQKEFEKSWKDDACLNSMEPENYNGYYRSVFKREEIFLKEIQRRQRYANIISIFSFFEGRLQSICNRIESKLNFIIKVDDLGDKADLMRYWKYLTKVLQIEKQNVERYFTPLNQQKEVRNIIVHQEGLVNSKQRNRVNFHGLRIEPFKEDYFQHPIGYEPKERIEIDYIYIECLLENVSKFFKKVLIAIDIRCNQIRCS